MWIKFIKKTWPIDKRFAFHSIITRPGDVECKKEWEHSFGYRYEELSKKTGGIIGTVCAPDYTNQLRDIGQGVRDQLSSVTLQCVAEDINNDGTPDLKVELENGETPPSFEVKGLKVQFESPLPVGNHRFYYHCLDTQKLK